MHQDIYQHKSDWHPRFPLIFNAIDQRKGAARINEAYARPLPLPETAVARFFLASRRESTQTYKDERFTKISGAGPTQRLKRAIPACAIAVCQTTDRGIPETMMPSRAKKIKSLFFKWYFYVYMMEG
jgi:hypothetical protein